MPMPAAAPSPAKKDPALIVANLKERFPGATIREIEAALNTHGDHAGRAAKALEKSEASKPAEEQLSEDKIAMAFKLFDADGSGSINLREVCTTWRTPQPARATPLTDRCDRLSRESSASPSRRSDLL